MEKNHYAFSASLPYRGRFAPTPSGALHLGSLSTALASWLQARINDGIWLLRIDDLDRQRCVAGSADLILRQLAAHGLHWDETPRYQSDHTSEYAAALVRMQERGLTYRCACTRAQLAKNSLPGPDGPVYAGTCRTGTTDAPHALRLRLDLVSWCIDDEWQGRLCRNLTLEVGDPVVWRKDGQPGYALACVVDEVAQGITEVVRGADLCGASVAQTWLNRFLGFRSPHYKHLPVLVDRSARKLSKQNRAEAIANEHAGENLWRCLHLLGQLPPQALRRSPPPQVLEWALLHWRPSQFSGRLQVMLEDF